MCLFVAVIEIAVVSVVAVLIVQNNIYNGVFAFHNTSNYSTSSPFVCLL